jgi:hypothetical protein
LGIAFVEKQNLLVWLGCRSVKRCFSSVNRGERHDAAVATDEAIGRCAPRRTTLLNSRTPVVADVTTGQACHDRTNSTLSAASGSAASARCENARRQPGDDGVDGEPAVTKQGGFPLCLLRERAHVDGPPMGNGCGGVVDGEHDVGVDHMQTAGAWAMRTSA